MEKKNHQQYDMRSMPKIYKNQKIKQLFSQVIQARKVQIKWTDTSRRWLTATWKDRTQNIFLSRKHKSQHKAPTSLMSEWYDQQTKINAAKGSDEQSSTHC